MTRPCLSPISPFSAGSLVERCDLGSGQSTADNAKKAKHPGQESDRDQFSKMEVVHSVRPVLESYKSVNKMRSTRPDALEMNQVNTGSVHHKFLTLSLTLPARIVCVPFCEQTPHDFYLKDCTSPNQEEVTIANGLARDLNKRIARQSLLYSPSANKSGVFYFGNKVIKNTDRFLQKNAKPVKRLVWNSIVELGNNDPVKSLTSVIPTLKNPDSQIYLACHGFINRIYRFSPELFAKYFDSLLSAHLEKSECRCQIKVMACHSAEPDETGKSFAENLCDELRALGYANIRVSGYEGAVFENDKHRHSQSQINQKVSRASKTRKDFPLDTMGA